MHDFKAFPELTNAQLEIYYWDSPHKQILDDFRAKVVKVTDGDTIRVKWSERDFTFPIRFLDLAAPELDERGGKESQGWLESQILGKEVDIEIDQDLRVEKWGRLLGRVILNGIDVGEESVLMGHAIPWGDRNVGTIPDFAKEMDAVWR